MTMLIIKLLLSPCFVLLNVCMREITRASRKQLLQLRTAGKPPGISITSAVVPKQQERFTLLRLHHA